MPNLHRELDHLRREIQRHRATLRALQRESDRIHGKDVIHSSSESDHRRMMHECGCVPDSPNSVRMMIKSREALLADYKAKAAEVKEELDTRFPLTPCALYRLLRDDPEANRRKKAKKRRKQKRRRH